MKAMFLKRTEDLAEEKNPLSLMDIPVPEPKDGEILIRVSACGVCHTEIDEIEGRTPPPQFPVIPGHQVVGHVVKCGTRASQFQNGDRVGVGWIFSACKTCSFCINGNENLCQSFKATGRDANGGYAEYMIVHEDFAYSIPDNFSDVQAAPLLCAGAIGYRSFRLSGLQNGQSLGLTGFGASAHIVLKMAKKVLPKSPVFVFARSASERKFALDIGADWAGDTTGNPPEPLDAIIDTTPAWKPVLFALQNLKSGGRLIINAVGKEDRDKEILLSLDYKSHLWMEKEIKSAANVTRLDVSDFLRVASEIPIIPEVQLFRLEDANLALIELKDRKIRGAKVLKV